MEKKFDFSKIEDQQAFEQLSSHEKEDAVGRTQEEAEAIRERAQIIAREEEETDEQDDVKSEHYNKASIEFDRELFERLPEMEQKKIVEDAQEEAYIEKLTSYLSAGFIHSALKIKEAFNLSEDDIQDAVYHGLISRLSKGSIESALKIKDRFSLPDALIQEAAAQGFFARLARGYIDDAFKIKEAFSLPEEVVQEAARQGLADRLARGFTDDDLKIKERFFLSDTVVQEVATKGFIKVLSDGFTEPAFKIKNRFNLSEEMIAAAEVQEAARQGLINCLSGGYIEDARKISRAFDLPEGIFLRPEVQEATKHGFIARLSGGSIESAFEIKNRFNLSEEMMATVEVKEAINQALISCLVRGDRDTLRRIGREFKLDENEVFARPEIQEAAQQGMIAALSRGHVEYVEKLREHFRFPLRSETIIKEVDGVRELLEKIESFSSIFLAQAEKSVDVLLALIPFKGNPEALFNELKENPFLTEAVSENPRFGSKLLLKYPEFDQYSKENIEFLFNAKKEIIAADSAIDPASLEFRQAMQEKLDGYKNNQEIISEAKARGIDVSEWLNYGETKHFNLEAGESLAFSETVSAPVERVRETISAYAHGIKETMKEYKAELAAYAMPLEDVKEIEAKIADMQEEMARAKNEGNERKAQGIQKGVESMQKKAENIKTIPAWDKLVGDIDAFQRLKEDVHQAHEKLMHAEKTMEETLSGKMPSGKAVQDLKRTMAGAKEELRSKFSILERRIKEFKERLPQLVVPALGEERTAALVQELEQNLAEQFDHYDTDRSTLTNLFSERSDKEKEAMEHRPMSIFVWARNPDVDLYQGNYSPCCICIESAHMGAESTIADYNTDLGVQIVSVWDEAKNEPVTAAWCWLGEDGEGDPALVVDNIEANTVYSSAYPEQLTKELFEYLKEYAIAIGAKTIVLGKANNDLPTGSELAKLPNSDLVFTKLGGHNRSDGYFLEAEEQSVKVIWEAGASPIEKREVSRERIEKTSFANITVSELTADDLAAIRRLEEAIYDDDLQQGYALIEGIKEGNGLAYSVAVRGERSVKEGSELIGYLAAVEDETEEGDPCVYVEDIAVIPEAQGQGVGWRMFEQLIEKLKAKARVENKPMLLDMHLRDNSQRFMERHRDDLARMDVTLIEDALVPDYYDEGDDALYKVYEVKSDTRGDIHE